MVSEQVENHLENSIMSVIVSSKLECYRTATEHMKLQSTSSQSLHSLGWTFQMARLELWGRES